ncbi:MAG: hypothetical protein U0Q19_07820 [Kineosporiaceae bacterium]
MSDLRERLDRLAEGASGDLDAAQLWTAGRRRHRLRTTAGALAVLLIATVSGLGGATVWQRTATSLPAAPPASGVYLPDRLVTPPAWLEGTEVKGPIGPLVALVGGARRDGWRTVRGVVGVSAHTGEYRFLDLPGAAESNPGTPRVELSPDGRWVAYWIGGRQVAGAWLVTGLALYDTVTGQVRTHPVESDQGVLPRGILWEGQSAWFSYGQVTSVDESSLEIHSLPPLAWPVLGEPRVVAGVGPDELPKAAADGLVLLAGLDNFAVVVNELVYSRFRVEHIGNGSGWTVLSPPRAGRRLVAELWVPESQTSPQPIESRLMVGDLDGALLPPQSRGIVLGGPTQDRIPAVAMKDVSSAPAVIQGLLGWRDADHVIAVLGESGSAGKVASVDIHTGASEALTRLDVGDWSTLSVAAEAWTAPVAPAVIPDWPPDPRLVALAIGGGVLVLALTGGAVRGRVRRSRRGRS